MCIGSLNLFCFITTLTDDVHLFHRADAPIIAQVWEHYVDYDLESGLGYKYHLQFLLG